MQRYVAYLQLPKIYLLFVVTSLKKINTSFVCYKELVKRFAGK